AEAGSRRERWDRFDTAVRVAEFDPVIDGAAFTATLARVEELTDDLNARREGLDDERAARHAQKADLLKDAERIRSELASLASRTTNLPSSQLDVRAELCETLGLDETDLPFAGELLDVRDEHEQWRGAAERVLRGFAMSLLVPQQHYDRVS